MYSRSQTRRVAADLLPEEGSLHAALDALSVVTVPADALPDGSLYNVNTHGAIADPRRQLRDDE